MKQRLLIQIALIFLALAFVAQAAQLGQLPSATTSLFFDNNQKSAQITDGQSIGVIVSADSVLESSMTVTVSMFDSAGNRIATLLAATTYSDSYYKDVTVDPSAYSAPGSYTIVSTVRAASGQTATDILDLQVVPAINLPPIITSTPITQVDENKNYNYQVSAFDPENDPISYSFETAPAWLSINPSTGLVTGIAPEVNADTQYEISIVASDGKGSTSQKFILTVKDTTPPINTPPVITSTPVTSVNEGQAYSYQVTATDAEHDPLTYSLVQKTAWLSIDPSTGLITGTAAQVSQDSTYAIVVQVSDGTNMVRQSYLLTVHNIVPTPTGHPPVITSSPVTDVDEGQAYSYQVTATDADNDPLTYSLAQKTSWLSIDPSTGLITGTAPQVSQDSTYGIAVQVSDGTNIVEQDYVLTVKNVVVPVPTNHAPVITSSPVTQVDEKNTYNYQVTATDADMDSLDYSFSGPSWLSINSATGLLTGTAPSVAADTSYQITVSVSDGKTQTSQTYTLTVYDTSVSGGSNGGESAGLPVVPNVDFEQQQYLAQFEQKTVNAEQPKESTKTGSSNLLLIIAIVLFVLILALTVYLIYRSMKD